MKMLLYTCCFHTTKSLAGISENRQKMIPALQTLQSPCNLQLYSLVLCYFCNFHVYRAALTCILTINYLERIYLKASTHFLINLHHLFQTLRLMKCKGLFLNASCYTYAISLWLCWAYPSSFNADTIVTLILFPAAALKEIKLLQFSDLLFARKIYPVYRKQVDRSLLW